MVFNSLAFLIFFPIVALLYFKIAKKYRLSFLLVASCFFYMYFVPVYILVMLADIVIDYFFGIFIHRAEGRKKYIYFVIAILLNLSFLFYFKYYNFFIQNFSRLSSLLHISYAPRILSLLMPLGLSFHTFQSISYLVEIHRGSFQPEKRIGVVALYILFFPQLVSGPIERPQELIPQLLTDKEFSKTNAVIGLRRILWGFLKKMVIADGLGVVVNYVYNDPHKFTGLPLIMATYLFAFQIYFDFAGYTDIAIGSAKILGFDLVENFNLPYGATSIAEFWRKWHMSLSRWIQDYLFKPIALCFGRIHRALIPVAIILTMALCGLWHGASWNYIIFGTLHGVYMAVAMIWKRRPAVSPSKLYRFGQQFIVFNLVGFTWIFFRAANLQDAGYIITHLFTNIFSQIYQLFTQGFRSVLPFSPLALLLLVVLVFFTEQGTRTVFSKRGHYALYYFIILLILLLGQSSQQFIYFQF